MEDGRPTNLAIAFQASCGVTTASLLTITSRSMANTPNQYTVEFQDEFNEYQQDSLSLVDIDDFLVSAGQK